MILVVLLTLVSYGAAETTSVRGSVHCGFAKKSAPPTVYLMEEDFSNTFLFNWFDSDDVLDTTMVEYGEHFTLDGSEVEIFSTEPYLLIAHQCFDTPREEIVDLSDFAADHKGIIHLGYIILTHQGYTINPIQRRHH